MEITLLLILSISITWSKPNIVMDLDKDGKIDSITLKRYENENRIEYTLSSLGKKIFKSDILESYNSNMAHIEKTKSGFKYCLNFMRGGSSYQFRYEKSSKKMRLIGMEHYEFGNAGHEGRGESSVNLLTGKYIAQWSYSSPNNDKLITPIATQRYYNFDKFYIDGFSSIIDKYYELDNGVEDIFPLK